MVSFEDLQVFLDLERLVSQFVVWSERLKSKRSIGSTSAQDIHHREEFSFVTTAFVLVSISNDQVIGHVATDTRVQFCNYGFDVLHNAVVRVLEIQSLRSEVTVTET